MCAVYVQPFTVAIYIPEMMNSFWDTWTFLDLWWILKLREYHEKLEGESPRAFIWLDVSDYFLLVSWKEEERAGSRNEIQKNTLHFFFGICTYPNVCLI